MNKLKITILTAFIFLMFFSKIITAYSAVTSIGEINVEGNDQGKVLALASSKATLIATLIIVRLPPEPGEEIKTIEFVMPAEFSADPSEVTEVLLNAKRSAFTPKVSDASLRIELAEPILDVNTVSKIVFKVSTLSVTMPNATFLVRLRNRLDDAIGDFVRPGPADGKQNNDSFTLTVIPNIPPPTPTGLNVKVDPTGENDVFITWEKSTDPDVRGYFIYRDDNPRINVAGIYTTAFMEINVPPGTHTYTIEAYKGSSGQLVSPQTQPQTVNVNEDRKAPESPMDFTIKFINDGVGLTWKASPTVDVVKYVVSLAGLGPISELEVESDKVVYGFADRRQLESGRFSYSVEAVDEAQNKSEPAIKTICKGIWIWGEFYWDWYSVAFSPDGSILASGGYDRIKLWDVKSFKEIATLEKTSHDEVWSVAFSPDGNILASGGHNVILWDIKSLKEIEVLLQPWVWSVAFSPDGTILAAGGSSIGSFGRIDNTIQLWDMKSFKKIGTINKAGHSHDYSKITFSPDGSILAGVDEGTIKLWDVKSLKEIRTIGNYYSVAFSPDGSILAGERGGQSSGIIKLWDMKNFKEITTLEGYSGTCLAFSPDGTILAAGGGHILLDNAIQLWDMKSLKEIMTLGCSGSVYSLAFSPDSTILASANEMLISRSKGNVVTNASILLWDMKPYIEQVPQQPNIVVSEESHKFNDTLITTHSDWNFTISNAGNSNLTINGIDSDNPAFTITPLTFPQDIAPGKSLNVTAIFSPAEEKSYTGIITITSNVPDKSSVSVSLEGMGVPDIGCAVIVTASGVSFERMIDNKANKIYKSLHNLGFDDNRIYYLNDEPQDTDGNGDNDVDSDNTKDKLEEVITKWAPQWVGSSGPLILYVASHGSKVATFELNKSESVTSLDLNLWFNEFSKQAKEAKIIIVIDACYSGSFITDAFASISSTNRIIITSTRDDKLLSGILNHFGYGFFKWLEKGEDVLQAFIKASEMDLKTGVILGEPWIDDNGDGIGHPAKSLADDGKVAATVKIGRPGAPVTETEGFVCATLFSPGELRVYDAEGRVTGLVNGNIKEEIPNSVYIEESKDVIIFPSANNYRYEVVGTDAGKYGLTVASIKGEETTTFNAKDISITAKTVHQYSIDWDALSNDKGVTINIDSNGDGKFEETINSGASFIAYNCDVNSDGVVNILDLVIVGKYFGKSAPDNAKADVNKDGIVDILDLNIVGQYFGEVYK